MSEKEILGEELEAMYWGQNYLPSEWMSVEEIAATLNVPEEFVKSEMEQNSIPRRTADIDLHRDIWNLLTEVFRMIPETHFLYRKEGYDINRVVDFYVVKEAIGIVVSVLVPSWETRVTHIGNGAVISIGCSDSEKSVTLLERQLKDMGVKKRYVREVEDNEGW